MVIIDYTDYTDFQDYIKNNFIIDYADCTDYQDHLKNCFITDYAGCADIQLYVKNNFIIDYTDYVERLLLIIHSSMTTFIFKRKREIVITDYVDYPALHITVTYTGIFSRKFNVVLHVSLTERIKIIRRSINDNPRSLTIPLEGNTCIISSSILTCGNTS